MTIILIIAFILILLFIEKCSLINLSTADAFKPNQIKNSPSLVGTIQSESYEIVPLEGNYPILFDSVKNEFYFTNKKGLTKIDAQGNIILSADLNTEHYTSVSTFENYTPYVFAVNGVYDFSGNELVYTKYSKILNTENEMNNTLYKSTFEQYYDDAEIVVYEGDGYVDLEVSGYPMYFKINKEWIQLYAQKRNYKFSNIPSSDMDHIIGQIDLKNFPAKFADKRLQVLKDNENGIYSTRILVDDQYLNTFYTEILKEQKFYYNSNNKIKMVSYKKDEYLLGGGYFYKPDWVFPSFINTAYFELTFNNEKLYFKEKAIKHFFEFNYIYDLYLFELPKNKSNIKVAFLDYDLSIGGYTNNSTDEYEPRIKNTGLYLVRPKKNKR